MEIGNDSCRRPNGAFRPITGCHSHDYPKSLPPEQFVASRLVGGLKHLFSKLSITKKDVQSQETPNVNQILHHSSSVPNLAARYKVLQLIGEGQSSVILAAEDLYHPTKRVVAIKIMNLDHKTLGTQEAECIQQLNRADPLKLSKIVRLLNKFTFDGHFCMAFEILRPRPLHYYFQRTDFNSEEEILEKLKQVTIQILGVLGFLRRENVIHADLKPENILLESGEKINIKVVDFGNAIHWVHQEMSLYYDNFELQTLLYRAPEVMFGISFGPEIDMWSTGCIVAELYLGEPLFMGQSKMDVLQKMCSLLGHFPRIPFQSGKFYTEFFSLISSKTGAPVPSLEMRLMKKLHNTRNFTFANFLSGFLKYDSSNRFTPVQAASHPFLAPHMPFSEFLTTTGDDVQDISETRRSGVLLTPSQYPYRPNMDEDIRRQHLSSIDLLHCGTRRKVSRVPKRTSTPLVGRVAPIVKEDTERVGYHGISRLKSGSGVDLMAAEKTVEHRTHGCVLHGKTTSGQEQMQSVFPHNEVKPFFTSEILENNSGSMFEKPAEQPRLSEENTFVLTVKTKSMPSSNEPVAGLDTSRAQMISSERVVEEQDTIDDTLKDKRGKWLEGDACSSTHIGGVSMESPTIVSRNLDTKSSARTRIYCQSNRSKLCTTRDTTNDFFVEENPFLINTDETNTRASISIKIADIKDSTRFPQRNDLPEDDNISSLNRNVLTYVETRTRQDNSHKKNVKLNELEKETRKKQGDTQSDVTPKIARRSLKLTLPHEDDQRDTIPNVTPKNARRCLKLKFPHEDDEINFL